MPFRTSARRAAHSVFSARRVASRVVLAPFAAPLLAAVLLGACRLPVHQDSAAPPPDPFNPAATQLLDNTQWQLVEWTRADGSARTVPGASAADAAAEPASGTGAATRLATPAGSAHEAHEARAITLDLSTASGQRRASGFSGCNRYTGTYTLKNGLLSFGPLAGTRMACVGASGEIEGAYLDALTHIARSGVQMREPQALLLVLDSGERLTFAQRSR